jgi:general secretion pathway protein K
MRRGRAPAPRGSQSGAALLMALLTVALVATLASAALWRQWRNVEVEAHDRSRMQAGWVLSGALDWARLILREDARAGGPDHLGEPWSVPLQESRLSTFLAIDPGQADGSDEVFLSGQITDAQSRMNVRNLFLDGKVSEPDQQAFARLFELLGLEPAEVDTLAANLVLALGPAAPAPAAGASEAAADDSTTREVPLLPRRLDQLAWLGLSEASAQVLAPYVTLLPVRTPLNVNSASAEALAASIPGLDLTDAQAIVSARQRAPFRALAALAPLLPPDSAALVPGRFSVGTRFFDVRGRLRMEQLVVEERSLLLRNGMEVSILWRERERARAEPAPDVDTAARSPASAPATSTAGQGPILTMPP